MLPTYSSFPHLDRIGEDSTYGRLVCAPSLGASHRFPAESWFGPFELGFGRESRIRWPSILHPDCIYIPSFRSNVYVAILSHTWLTIHRSVYSKLPTQSTVVIQGIQVAGMQKQSYRAYRLLGCNYSHGQLFLTSRHFRSTQLPGFQRYDTLKANCTPVDSTFKARDWQSHDHLPFGFELPPFVAILHQNSESLNIREQERTLRERQYRLLSQDPTYSFPSGLSAGEDHTCPPHL